MRVCRGLYAPIPLDAISPSEWREDPWVIAVKLFGPDYYIGGWTACEHWSFTTQIFMDTVVVTTRKMRSKRIRVQGFPFIVKRAPEKIMFGTKPVWRDQARVNVSDPSRTLVDILDDPSVGGGIGHVADVMDTYFRGSTVTTSFFRYVGRAGNRVVFKRLGYILEALEVRAPALLQECEAAPGAARLGAGLRSASGAGRTAGQQPAGVAQPHLVGEKQQDAAAGRPLPEPPESLGEARPIGGAPLADDGQGAPVGEGQGGVHRHGAVPAEADGVDRLAMADARR